MTEKAITGGCLCRAVHFSATLPDDAVQLCHCRQCQRWTGGGMLASVRVRDLKMTGEDVIRHYRASGHGERAFCGTCGTTLYWRMQDRDIAFLPAGLLDDQAGLRVTEEIFTDCRAPWMHAFDGAAQHDEAEMQAQLAAFLAQQNTDRGGPQP